MVESTRQDDPEALKGIQLAEDTASREYQTLPRQYRKSTPLPMGLSRVKRCSGTAPSLFHKVIQVRRASFSDITRAYRGLCCRSGQSGQGQGSN